LSKKSKSVLVKNPHFEPNKTQLLVLDDACHLYVIKDKIAVWMSIWKLAEAKRMKKMKKAESQKL